MVKVLEMDKQGRFVSAGRKRWGKMVNKTIIDNGIRVISEEIDHVRSVSIGAWVEGGSRHEPA